MTRHTEKGRTKVTIIAGLNPRKKKLILKTKNIAKEKLFISSLNFFEVYEDSSYISSIVISSGSEDRISSTTYLALST